MRETELEMLQREKEAEHFKTWAEQEDNFHLHQAKLRLVGSNSCCISTFAASPFHVTEDFYVYIHMIYHMWMHIFQTPTTAPVYIHALYHHTCPMCV